MSLILNVTHRKRMPKVVAERLNTSRGLSNKPSPLHQSRIKSNSMYNQSQAKWSTVSMHNCVYIQFYVPFRSDYVNVPCRLSEYHSLLRDDWKLVVPLLPGLCHVTSTCSVAPAPSERPRNPPRSGPGGRKPALNLTRSEGSVVHLKSVTSPFPLVSKVSIKLPSRIIVVIR